MAAYYSSNALTHPEIDRKQFLVRSQGELKEIKLAWLSVLHQDKYRIVPPAGINTVVYDRFDTVTAKADIIAGKTKLPSCFFDRFKEIISMEFPAKHRFHAKGVELSPGDRPMDKTNVLVYPEKGGGIKEAVRLSLELDLPIVSKDVLGQLNAEQTALMESTDGIHQYATEASGKVTTRNPTGLWPVGDGVIGLKVPVQPGVVRVHHIRSREIRLDMTKLFRGTVDISVGSKLKEFYGLSTGEYRFGTEGLDRIGDCAGEGMSETSVRSRIEPFMLRDKYGYHGGDITMIGECSWKIDGIFCFLECRNGVANFKFRNGEIWSCKFPVDISAAFEMVGDEIYLLYVEWFKGNKIVMNKAVQDYFREKLEFIINLGGKFYYSVASCDHLPRDGIVIWGSTRQTYFKDPNSVDLTKQMMEEFAQPEDLGLFTEGMARCDNGKLYEFKVKDNFTIVPAKFQEIKEKDGSVTVTDLPQPRDPRSKILPNKKKNIEKTLKDPTIAHLKRYHAKEVEKNPTHLALCPVCPYLAKW